MSRRLGPPVRDRRILYAGAFLRSLGTSLIGVLLGIYLAKLHFDPAGAAAAALLVTLAGDRIGRRRALVVLAIVASRCPYSRGVRGDAQRHGARPIGMILGLIGIGAPASRGAA